MGWREGEEEGSEVEHVPADLALAEQRPPEVDRRHRGDGQWALRIRAADADERAVFAHGVELEPMAVADVPRGGRPDALATRSRPHEDRQVRGRLLEPGRDLLVVVRLRASRDRAIDAGLRKKTTNKKIVKGFTLR